MPRRRTAVLAALADPVRLAIVDQLLLADASPSELRAVLGMQSNLLAHHLGVLKKADVVRHGRSEADGRRTYLRLNHGALETLVPSAQRARTSCGVRLHPELRAQPDWPPRSGTGAANCPPPRRAPSPLPASTLGRWPPPGATTCTCARTRRATSDDVLTAGDAVIAVCDNAHEELPAELDPPALVGSRPDPNRAS